MDAAAFEQVYGSFRDFHAYFAPLFGRRETGTAAFPVIISRPCCLVQSGERRNAENLSETVPGSARGMQRFLTDSPWDDEVIIGRLQEYLGTRLEHPEGVWVLCQRQRLSQAGEEVGGSGPAVLREAGEGGQLPGGDVPGLCQPVVDGPLVEGAVSARGRWTLWADKDRCEAAGCPSDRNLRQGYRSGLVAGLGDGGAGTGAPA